jgi:hypothetical protein
MRAIRLAPIAIPLVAFLFVAVPAQATMTEAEAFVKASKEAVEKGVMAGNSIRISSPGAATSRRAQAVFKIDSINPPEEVVYSFLVTDGKKFVPNVPAPARAKGRPAKYLGLVFGASGEGAQYLYAGDTAVPIARIGPVVTIKLSSEQATAPGCKVDELLTAALRRKHLRTRLASAELSLKACREAA